MSIVSSAITADNPQKDGRRWISELHTDQLGLKYPFSYLAPNAAWDAIATMNARVATINANLTASEIASNVAQVLLLGSLASPVLNYSTAAANFASLRTAYATATQVQAVMIGDFLSSLTDVQLETAFGFTLTQVTTLRSTKLTPAATAAATIRATTGQ